MGAGHPCRRDEDDDQNSSADIAHERRGELALAISNPFPSTCRQFLSQTLVLPLETAERIRQRARTGKSRDGAVRFIKIVKGLHTTA